MVTRSGTEPFRRRIKLVMIKRKAFDLSILKIEQLTKMTLEITLRKL